MASSHHILCHPLFFLPSIFPSIRVFSSEKSFPSGSQRTDAEGFSISPSSEYSGFISFRIDWLDLLAVQGTLRSLLQHHNLKASILRHSAFFMVQLSHLYITTRKTIDLTIQTFVGKVMSVLFNTLYSNIWRGLPSDGCWWLVQWVGDVRDFPRSWLQNPWGNVQIPCLHSR